MNFIRILYILALLGLLVGCEKSVPRADYFPLRDGNRWEYRLLDKPLLTRLSANQPIETASLTDASNALCDGVEKDLPAKAEIVMDAFAPVSPREESTPTIIARRVALELRAAVDELTYRAIYDTAEQVWSKRNGYVGFQSARGRSYLLILPPHSGYKWVVTGAAGQDLFYEIETTTAAISTPRQTFQQCVLARQESRDRREIWRYWFAPDVGLVRRSKYFANEEVFRQELVDYTVKPATPATRLAEDREVRKAIEGKNRGSEFHQRTRNDLRERRFEADTSEPNERADRIRKYSEPK